MAFMALFASSGPSEGAAPFRFLDASDETGLEFTHFNGMVGALYFSEMMGSGAALLDYDRDGDLDLYLVQGSSLAGSPEAADGKATPGDRLLRADWATEEGAPTLLWVDVSESSGVTGLGDGMGVATADYDGDGWTDLFVTQLGPDQLLRNRGDGSFEDVTEAAGVGDPRWAVAATFADVDRDGRLDLYVGNYVNFRAATHKQCVSTTGVEDYCGPLAYEPEADVLYRNLGDGRFEDISRRSGVESRPGGALGVVAFDADGDGWVDFYVANDQVPNKLWRNDGTGSFVDDALIGGVGVNEAGQPEASMGLALGDLTGDGTADLFVSHLSRETNTLYSQVGDGFFEDSTRGSGLDSLSFAFTGFGVAAVDVDFDGRLDLFVANGAVKRQEDQVRAGDPHPLRQTNQAFRNLGRGRFVEATAEVGSPLARADVSRGVAAGDIDNDGRTDLVVTNNAGPAQLLLNRTDSSLPWSGIAPASLGAGWLGTRVVVESSASGVGSAGSSGWMSTDGSYASASDARVVLALPEDDGTRLRLSFPDGARRILVAPPLRRYLNLEAR